MPEKDRLDTILDAVKGKSSGGSRFPLAKDTKAVVDSLTFPMDNAKHWWEWWPIQLAVIAAICIGIAAARQPDPIPVHKSGPDRTPVTTVTR